MIVKIKTGSTEIDWRWTQNLDEDELKGERGNLFTLRKMHNSKATKGHLVASRIMRWFQNAAGYWAIGKLLKRGKKILCIIFPPALPWWTMGQWMSRIHHRISKCENLNITFLPQSFFLTCPLIKYNSSSQYQQLFLILWKWVQTVSWLDPEVSTAFGCSLDKKMDWSHDHCIVCLSAFYTILKLKSINCFICQFRNKWKPSRRQYLVKLKAGIGLPIIDHH